MGRTLALTMTLALCLAACAPSGSEPPSSSTASSLGSPADEPSSEPGRTAAVELIPAALTRANDCEVLLGYFIDQALEQVGPWGLDGPGFYGEFALGGEEAAADTAVTSAPGDGARSADPSATNVQVEGVDEADIVKAVGDLLYVVADTRLLVMSTADGALERLGTVDLGQDAWGNQILVHGDRLVLMGAGSSTGAGVVGPTVDTFVPVSASFATVTMVDVSDPSDPVVERTLTIDGSVVASRLVEGHLRVVIQAQPVGLAWSYPEGAGLRAERAATERNREIVRNSTIENWLPYLVASDGDERILLDCGDVLLPPEPSGLGTLSILDFDLAAGGESWEAAAVVASGSTVYANLERTYIATSRWVDRTMITRPDQAVGHVTRIHRFDTPVDGTPTYVASGDVDGFLLSQFAMDEYEDHLRVASTTQPPWFGEGSGDDSESRVTVFAVDGDRLAVTGSVDGLGVTETIRAVRFMGPVGYVVTFRQTDPLYVIDLADPAAPVTAGELKIPGFSAYLHPVGEGRLLGVGQDAEEDTGRTLGLQLSLFDVTDPTDPNRLDTFTLTPPDGSTESGLSSPVEWDHKAFTSIDGAAFVPYEGWSWNEDDGTETLRLGIVEADWSGDTLEESRALPIFEGRPTGDEWSYSPQRTVVKGDVAYVVGQGGITVLDLQSGDIVEQQRF